MSTTSTVPVPVSYIHFEVLDYSNTNVLSTYTLEQTPLTFVPDFTLYYSSLTANPNISNKTIRWDFGDGTYSTDLTAKHSYKWPGQYVVTLTVFNSAGLPVESSFSPTIYAQDFIPTELKWGDYGKFVYDVPAGKLGDPLPLYTRNSWQNYDAIKADGGITINFYASGAAGDYEDQEMYKNDKWAHLRLLSRFYVKELFDGTEQLVVVDSISSNVTEIYARIANNSIQICSAEDENSFFVGTTGYNEIYYVDDRVKNFTTRENPIFLMATFDSSKFGDEMSTRRDIFKYIDYPPYGFQQYPPAVIPVVKVRHNPAQQLSITTTGIDGEGSLSSTVFKLPEISWQCTEIPFVIKFKDDEMFTTKTYPPLYSNKANLPLPQGLYNTLTNNIISYWTFDNDGTDNVSLSDTTGNGYTLTAPGTGVLIAPGLINSSAYFDGNSYLTLSSFNDFNSSEFTISFWTNFNGSTVTSKHHALLLALSSNGTSNGSIFVTYSPEQLNGGVNLVTTNDGVTYKYIPSKIFPTDDDWHHIAITFNGQRVYFYIDGEFAISATCDTIPLNNPSLFIGGSNITFSNISNYKGAIDEAGIWRRLLTAPEIFNLNNYGIGQQYPFLADNVYDIDMGIITTDDNGNTRQLENVVFNSNFNEYIPQSYGGFFKGYFISNEAAYNCTLTASVMVIDPSNFPKDSLIGWIAIPQTNYILRLFREQLYSSCPGAVTMTLTSAQVYFDSQANRNIYAICVAPSGAGKGNDYQAWFADSITDTILKRDASGVLLSSIPLSSAPTKINTNVVSYVDYRQPDLGAASPSSIALDGNSDLWVALFDSGYVIKIDGVYGNVISVAYPPTQNFYYWLSAYGNTAALSGFAGEGLFLPSSIETDQNNNVWVAYSHPVSNIIVNYDTTGNTLNVIPLPPVVSPIEICADRNKFVWVTTFNHTATGFSLSGRNDLLYKFDYNGNIVRGFPIDGFKMLNNIAIDGRQNAWVSQDRETITKIDGITTEQTSYIAGSGLNDTDYICSLAGITVDTSDYAWVINNFDQRAYIIDTLIPPTNTLNAVNGIDLVFQQPNPLYPISGMEILEFQAYGDWFGSRWINKYMIPTSVIRTITGSSSTFNLYPTGGQYGLAKINENFAAKEFYDSLRYQEILLDKQVFFDQFLGSIVGDAKAQSYELGKTIYEKIANFVDNKANITTCNIDELVDFCSELSIQFEQYNYPYPPQLKRLLNILSIKQKNLWGDANTFSENFDFRGTLPPHQLYGTNLGTMIDPITGIIRSGVPVVAYELFSNAYTLINNLIIPDTSYNDILPLSTFSYNWGWNLVAPMSVSGIDIKNYYNFYTFNPSVSGQIYNNIIDWSNPATTLTFSGSSFDNWSSDSGIMANLISYELTKGLRLFTSAADITYNN